MPETPFSDHDEWLDAHFRTVNLIDYRAAIWSVPFSRARAQAIWRREVDRLHGDHVVLLGRKVAAAFGAERRDWFDTWTEGLVRFWLLPHPSGRNLLLNDEEMRRRIGLALADAIK